MSKITWNLLYRLRFKRGLILKPKHIDDYEDHEMYYLVRDWYDHHQELESIDNKIKDKYFASLK